MAASANLIGVGLALSAAFLLAGHYLLARIGMDGDDVSTAIVVVMATNIVLLVPTVGVYYYPAYDITPTSALSFVTAGLAGTAFGRALTFASVDRIGASRTEPLKASSAIFATVFAVVLLGETLTGVHALAVLMIVGGVAVISIETTRENPQQLERRELLSGLALPILAAVGYGIEPVLATVGLEQGTPAAVGLVIKMAAAFLGFCLYLVWRSDVPSVADLYARNTYWYLLAGVLSTGFLLCYYVALEFAAVSVVVPVMALSTLFVLILSVLFMPRALEAVTWRLAGASLCVVGGVVVIGGMV